MPMIPTILWQATEEEKKASHLNAFMQWLAREKNIPAPDYPTLYQWSIEHVPEFWRLLAEYTGFFSFSNDKKVVSDWTDDFTGVRWFEGVQLNYAELIFRNANSTHPAIMYSDENHPAIKSISWEALRKRVASLAYWMKGMGVQKGDRVCSILPNIPETIIAFLATQSLGAIWSSCSPDFGNTAVLDRFTQIEPKLLFVTDGYVYNAQTYNKYEQVVALSQSLPTLQATILIPHLDIAYGTTDFIVWQEIMQMDGGPLQFEPLSFDHPLWILFSSGTTGKPKAITHSVGGNLIEHGKVLLLHWDVHPGERFFWYSTTGWMMWNFSVASLLVGATLVLYEGSPGYPHLARLWDMAAAAGVHHFGVGAAYLINCQKANLHFNAATFPHLRTIGSTGSPLPPEAFDWVYQHVKKNVWLISFSGGTDVCSGFVGGCLLLPVYKGEIQCRLLGCDLEAIDDKGNRLRDEVGEMVIRQPMPSMPLYFWKDPDNARYRSSYFEKYPGMWWHGDFITITSRDSVVIYGRSDATLNRDGVRIGTAEIYRVVDTLPEIEDSLITCIEKKGGRFFMPLFVKMKQPHMLTDGLKKTILQALKSRCSPRHVPDAIYAVPDIPYTISGKKMELPVKNMLMGLPAEKIASKEAIRNPESLDFFTAFTASIMNDS